MQRKIHLLRKKSSCCGAAIEYRNDGKPHCTECGKTQG